MQLIVENNGGFSFRGSVENTGDLLTASLIAGECLVRAID